MFFSLRPQQFDSAKAVLKRGNAILNKEVTTFSDTGDSRYPYDNDLIDYYALSVTLDSEDLSRYNKDRPLSLKSAGCPNFLNRSRLLNILLISAVIKNRLFIFNFK
jgi:hypothetical protein